MQDADDYLAAGVEDEDAMGKHRGGDPAKSLRFANKARDLYIEGLSKYPRSFDLAYNKARLELEIATHPQFSRVLDVAPRTVLTWSLASHEYALAVAPDDADLLFNTAQVLTTLAEEYSKGDTQTFETTLDCLTRALECQQKCVDVQERRLRESQTQIGGWAAEEDYEDEEAGVRLDSEVDAPVDHSAVQSQWVSIVEPVTTETILDTLLAQLNTLTVICNIINSALSAGSAVEMNLFSITSQVETQSQKIIQGRLAELTRHGLSQERLLEIELAKVNLTTALLEIAYRMRHVDLKQYRHARDSIFTNTMAVHEHANFWIADAKSLMSLNAAVPSVDTGLTMDSAALRWNVLSKAQTLLSRAATSPALAGDSDARARTHLLRGDISLSLHILALPPIEYAQARANRAQLLKNAVVFYRNAAKLYTDTIDADVAQVRSVVARSMSDQLVVSTLSLDVLTAELQAQTNHRDEKWIREQLEDIVDEGLIPEFVIA